MTDARKATAIAAAEFNVLGLSTIPVDEKKHPIGKWKEFQKARPDPARVSRLFSNGHHGVGVIMGRVSGYIEAIDVDVKYDLSGSLMKDYCSLIKDHSPELFTKLVIAKTVNNGYHIFYRCKALEGNRQLAQRPPTDEEAAKGDKLKTIIETRGEGGYVVATPTPGYEFVQGDFSTVQEITPTERDLLFAIARSFNQALQTFEDPHDTSTKNAGLSPGQDFNVRGDVPAMLAAHGWQETSRSGERIYFKRPGITDSKVSANYHTGLRNFFVFSTSTEFEAGKGYSAAAVYTQLEHGGDYKASYKALAQEGYGTKSENKAKPAAAENSLESLLSIKSVNAWIEEAKNTPTPRMLFGPFIYEKEITVMFGDTGSNKTALAVQISNSITTGEQILGLPMDADPAPVLLLDFELSPKQFEGRYSQEYTNHFQFDEKFRRIEINRNCLIPDGVDFENWLNKEIEAEIQTSGITRLVVDNITYLRSATETAKDALPLMKALIRLKQKYGLTILILAHTPKRDQSRPITVNDLQGSKMLSNFADSIFAIGKSTQPGIRYLKQIKSRSSEENYHSENVIVCKVAKPTNFLGLHFVEFGRESEHLLTVSDKVTAQDRAEMFLRQFLAAGEQLESEIDAVAQTRGIKSATLRRAKKSLEIISKKVGYPGIWYWSLPEGAQDKKVNEGDHISEDEHLQPEKASYPKRISSLAEGDQDEHLRAKNAIEGDQDEHLRLSNTKQSTYSEKTLEGAQKNESERLRCCCEFCPVLGYIGEPCSSCGEIVTDPLQEEQLFAAAEGRAENK